MAVHDNDMTFLPNKSWHNLPENNRNALELDADAFLSD